MGIFKGKIRKGPRLLNKSEFKILIKLPGEHLSNCLSAMKSIDFLCLFGIMLATSPDNLQSSSTSSTCIMQNAAANTSQGMYGLSLIFDDSQIMFRTTRSQPLSDTCPSASESPGGCGVCHVGYISFWRRCNLRDGLCLWNRYVYADWTSCYSLFSLMRIQTKMQFFFAYLFLRRFLIFLSFSRRPGALSQKLAPYSKSIVGVDIDPIAVQHYNTTVINQGVPPEGLLRGVFLSPRRIWYAPNIVRDACSMYRRP